MSTKLETVINDLAKEKSEFFLQLDTYTKVHYEKNGTARLFATTIRGAEIPLTNPIDPRDPRLNHDQQASFLESIYAARDNSSKQLEWALRFGEYTKNKTIIQKIKNITTFGKLTNQENQTLDSAAAAYIGWALLSETSDLLTRQAIKLAEFYQEIAEISKPIAKKLYVDYRLILSTRGFAHPIFQGDLDVYKNGILLSVREKKTKTLSR